MKRLVYALEASGFYLLFWIFKMMPTPMASSFGGWIGRTIGPRLGASKKALRHIERALPDFSEEQRAQALSDMWDNLGRVIAEYPHLKTISQKYVEIQGIENIKDVRDGEQAIFFTSHSGNWELGSIAPFIKLNLPIDVTYRAPNNPWVDRLLTKLRTSDYALKAHSKSRAGGRSLMKAVQGGNNVGFLIDQKYNEGLNVPFFGHDAMTNPIFVQLAQKYKLPIYPVQNIRVEGCSFRLIVYPSLDVFDGDGNPLPEVDVIEQAHALLEGWIRDNPGQWLWLHRRWKD